LRRSDPAPRRNRQPGPGSYADAVSRRQTLKRANGTFQAAEFLLHPFSFFL
jgi:hypothetical protein